LVFALASTQLRWIVFDKILPTIFFPNYSILFIEGITLKMMANGYRQGIRGIVMFRPFINPVVS
jgi:hypothetical protein